VAWRYPIPRHRLGGLKTGCPSSCLVWLARCRQHSGRSAKDQVLSTELHGEALLAAKGPELEPLINHLREVAQGRRRYPRRIRPPLAGWWFADTARRGEPLVAAALLMITGHVDLDELDGRVRGWDVAAGRWCLTAQPAD
jgi:hypothetical protein